MSFSPTVNAMPETGFIQRPRLVLASASPRRRELLASVGVVPVVIEPDVDETPEPGEQAVALVSRLAAVKSGAVEVAPNDIVIGADTVVVIDGDILGKPTDVEHARTMLQQLSGRSHETMTAVSVRIGDFVATEVSTTVVTFRHLADPEIDWYLATGEPLGKAGAYAIQGAAALFITSIAGSYSNVVGLPLSLLDDLLAHIGRPLISWSAG